MESTRERIVCAARQLFGTRGFEGTTTAEIARTAGTAEGSIYRYFRDKKELFVACVEPVVREAVLRERTVLAQAPPREVFRRLIMERFRLVEENKDVFDILFTEGKHHPEIARILLEQVSASITAEDWATLGQTAAAAGLPGLPNPLIMNVGMTAAIWAMLSVGPASVSLFANWPMQFTYEALETDFADFVCGALSSQVNK